MLLKKKAVILIFAYLGLSNVKGKCNYCKIKTATGKPNTFCKYASSFEKPHARCRKTLKFGLEKSEVEMILKAHNDYRRYNFVVNYRI